LYVTYCVTLMRPKIPSTEIAALNLSAHLSESPDATATNVSPFGTSTTAGPIITTNGYIPSANAQAGYAGSGNSTGISNNVAFSRTPLLGAASTGVVLPSIGNWLLIGLWYTANNNITGIPAIGYGVNVGSLNFANDGTVSSLNGYNSTGSTAYSISAASVVTNTAIGVGITAASTLGNLVSYSNFGTMTAGECDFYACQLPNMLNSVPILNRARDFASYAERSAKLETRLRWLEDKLMPSLSDLPESLIRKEKSLSLVPASEPESADDCDRPARSSSSSCALSVKTRR